MASESAVAQGLRACRVFARVSERSLALLARDSVSRRLPPRKAVFEQGARFDRFGVVTRGSVRAVVTERNGRQQLLYQVSPGDTFAEIPSFGLDETLWRVAAGDDGATIILIPPRTLRAACDLDARLGPRLARTTAARASLLSKRLMDLKFATTLTRVAQVLVQATGDPREDRMIEAPPWVSKLSQRQLAELAGTVRVVVARVLQSFQDSGAVQLSRGRVTRIRPTRLALHM